MNISSPDLRDSNLGLWVQEWCALLRRPIAVSAALELTNGQQSIRRGGGGVWDPEVCVPKMA